MQTNLKADVGTFSIVLTNSITDNNESPAQSFSETISFNVVVEDPCDTSTITPLGLSAQTIVNGGTYTWTFTEAVIAVETANEGQNLCGARSYKVYREGGTSTEVTGDWITITETSSGTYELVASPIDDTLVTGGALDLNLQILLPSQPNHVGIIETLSITVSAATCDCNLITWDNPGSAATLTVGVADTSSNTVTIPEASYNVASTTASPEIRVCATTTPCVLTYSSALIHVDSA